MERCNRCTRSVKKVRARPIRFRKKGASGVREYRYYVVPFNIYVNKPYVERWGTEYVVEVEKCENEIVIRLRPKDLGG